MKKIVLILITGLMSCSIPVTNKVDDKTSKSISNIATIVNNTKVKEECIPYEFNSDLVHSIYTQKSSIEKENPYTNKIKISINPSLIPPPWRNSADLIYIDNEVIKKIVTEDKYKNFKTDSYYSGIRFNNEDILYFSYGSFNIVINNSCSLDYFKSTYNLISLPTKENNHFFLTFNLNNYILSLEDIENYLLMYNHKFIKDIKEIEFSSLDAIKTFIFFINLSTKNQEFYKDVDLITDVHWTLPN